MRRTVGPMVCMLLPVLIAASASARAGQGEVTTVRITDEVLVADTQRLGINVSGDNYYSPPLLKRRFWANFEGVDLRRLSIWMPAAACGTKRVSVRIDGWGGFSSAWKPMLIESGRYTIMSGPDIWTSGRIVGFEQVQIPDPKNKDATVRQDVMLLDKAISVPDGRGHAPVVMVQASVPNVGFMHGLTGHRGSDQNELVFGDVHEGAFGSAALNLKGSKKPAFIRMTLTHPKHMACTGGWRVSLWAKRRGGEPTLRVIGGDTEVALETGTTWKHFEPVLDVRDVKGEGYFEVLIDVRGGDVLIDDIEVAKLGDDNPTAFTDDFVGTLKEMGIGVLRQLQMGGSSMENYLQPLLRMRAVSSGREPDPAGSLKTYEWTVNEFYALCDYLGADPWYSLPGTITPDEIRGFIEFLAAPPDVGYGRWRAAQGRAKPWTDAFKRIHVQVANEPITFHGNSPHIDTWRDLAQAAKSSPYYKPNIRIVASTQDVGSGDWKDPAQKWRRLRPDPPRVDTISGCSYFLQGLWKEDIDRYDGDEGLYRWVMALPLSHWRAPDGSQYRKHYLPAAEAGIGFGIYETSYHTTFGNATAAQRNGVVTSLGGALAQMGNLLYPMKHYGVRTQCQFTYNQFNFSPGGSFGEKFEGDRVRLWGVVLNQRAGHRRFRPIASAMTVANRVIGGRLMETVHEGTHPTFSATGRFEDTRGKRKPDGGRVNDEGVETRDGFPVLSSYAFEDGKRRGLILINRDLDAPRPVEILFEGRVRDGRATTWRLTGDRITATNEPEVGEPQVAIREDRIDGFASGHVLTLPPFSMTSIEWHVP